MRIGTMYFGRVEPIESECIETKFLVIGVPLVPLESIYLVDEVSRHGIVLEQVHGLSSVAGYLRLFLFFAAAGFGVWGGIESAPAMWVLGAVCAGAWLWSMIFLGRLSDREKAQRSALRLLTGIGAPPELLPADVRAENTERLEKAYAKIRAEDGFDVAEDWRDQLGTPTAGAIGLLLFALARYDGGAPYEEVWDGAVKA